MMPSHIGCRASVCLCLLLVLLTLVPACILHVHLYTVYREPAEGRHPATQPVAPDDNALDPAWIQEQIEEAVK